MDKLISMYDCLSKQGVGLYVWDLGQQKAATLEMGGDYAMAVDFDNIDSLAEETVVVYHEAGHIMTGATHKVASSQDLIERHENKAWKWAVEHLISADELNSAVAAGHTEIWDLAEQFGVTEEFMRKAVCYYTNGNLATDLYF